MRGIKVLLFLLQNRNGVTYKEIAKGTKLHLTTTSRIISEFYKKEYVNIGQRKSKKRIGRRWYNIVYPSNKLLKIVRNYKKFLELLNEQLKCKFGQR